jgi:hypothetical protein
LLTTLYGDLPTVGSAAFPKGIKRYIPFYPCKTGDVACHALQDAGQAIPEHRKHRASGQAVVMIRGRDFYLGPHGTKASKVEHDRLVSEWLVAGRRMSA